MRTALVAQHIATARGHLAAIRRHAEAAQARRRDITGDWRYQETRRGQRAREADLHVLAEEATAQIAGEVEGVRGALAWVEQQELTAEAPMWQTPSASALAAGERVRAMLDAGVHLRDVLGALRDDNDQPGMEYAHRNIRALVRAQVAATDPGRVDSPEVRSLAANMDRRLAEVRLPHMGLAETEYVQARHAVADLAEAVERDRRFWTATARGTATEADKIAYAMATDPKWVESMSDSGTWAEPAGPVEAANTPQAVEA